MDLLISNQSDSRLESFLLISIFYVQIISLFFSESLNIFNPNNAKSDKLLKYVENVFRIKGFLQNNYNFLITMEIILFILIIILIIHFVVSIILISKNTFYSFNKIIINYYIKIFLYVGYNIIFDICFSIFSFNTEETKPNFRNEKSSYNILALVIISIILIAISLFIYIFINIYYNDSFYLSNSYYAKMSCNYDIFWGINCLINSLLCSQVKTLTKEVFLIYNTIISIILFSYYIKHYLFYDKYINIISGAFHLLYIWTSIFCFIFAYLDFKEKGIIYILTSIVVCFFYFNIKNRIESNIFLNTPFYKINNKFYLLFYFRNIYDLINNVEESYNDKSLLSGIIKMHSIECPDPNCYFKTKEDIYLPLINKWNDRNKREVEDEVFLKNFLIIVMNYFLYAEICSADMYLNLSLYYLKVIGNYCQAIYYYKKVTELKLSLREKFSFTRLSIQISRALLEKVKPSNEPCTKLENLDVSMYYKYEELCQNFIDEISNDVNLCLDFWQEFQAPYIEVNRRTDFNKIFKLTDKIRLTKENIESMWNKLIKIYGGVNDYFELYLEYTEQINDDDLKKRDLESLKRKNDSYVDPINNNFNNILFNKETCIIIANGDKGNEGVIELCNKEVENIFKYESRDLKGMNLSCLMPKVFAKDHSKYIERYFNIGQKKLIDKSDFNTFGKDKNNSIIKIKAALKLFPILNDNVFFIGLIKKENIDDIIFLDENFNIQGMSLKLMKILNINNKYLFQDNEIPFYMICRKFVNFYNIFLKGKNEETSEKQAIINNEEEDLKDDIKGKEEQKIRKNNEKEEIHENIEINENIELEYEIKLPQFLIDYSEKSNKKEVKSSRQLLSIKTESDQVTDIIEEYDEEDLLMEEERNKDKVLNEQKKNTINKNDLLTPTPTPTTTPIGDTITPMGKSDSVDEDSEINNAEQNVVFNKESEEEKIYNTKLNQYKSLFNEGKFNELEELIISSNKNSLSIEYKFNFTFDKYKYGNKQISYIVRCIDTKNEFEENEEESAGEIDPKGAKYKKEKAESIKPLFELLEEERKEIMDLPQIFLNLTLESKKFQKLLQECKNDINIMSKTHGQKKDEILEDENSSQTSQAGFDSGLVKKNRIEEIRSNLMNDISNFYMLKYIKANLFLICISTIIFFILYIVNFYSLFANLLLSSVFNINLFRSTLMTSELIGIFVSLRVVYLKEIINKSDNNNKEFDYLDFLTEGDNLAEYYDYCLSQSKLIQERLFELFGFLEMAAPNYLSEKELNNLYWDRISISYFSDKYKIFSNETDHESFPMAISQLLSNSLSYIDNPLFNSLNSSVILPIEATDIAIFEDKNNTRNLFDYITFLVIENGYENVLPNLFNKLKKVPDIIGLFNRKLIDGINTLVFFYIIFIIILCIILFYQFYFTNKSMIKGMDKVSKIKFERIEEILKKIKSFNLNLKKFREKDIKIEDNRERSEIYDDDSKIKSKTKNDNNSEKKIESSLVNNNGFNLDNKKYIPLRILNYLYFHSFFIVLYVIICIIIIYSSSFGMIYNTNKLLKIQSYIFGKLITTSTRIIEIKCYISECKNKTEINYTDLVNYSDIKEVIIAINLFSKTSKFYNEQYLFDACGAAIYNTSNSDEYEECLSDSIIKTTNNTDNLLKYVDDLISALKKECEIQNRTDGNYYKKNLFNETNYRDIEKIFFKYFMGVDENFINCISIDLSIFLSHNQTLVIIYMIIFSLILIVLCVVSRIIIIKKLIHHITISRCVFKIIPTSVILNTPELEGWIENKY